MSGIIEITLLEDPTNVKSELITYIGRLIKKTSEYIQMQTKFGILRIPLDDIKKAHISDEEKYQASQGPKFERETYVPTTRTYTATGPRPGPSKMNDAITLYKSLMMDNEHPSRKMVIEKFIEHIGLTPAGASTYQQVIKKQLS